MIGRGGFLGAGEKTLRPGDGSDGDGWSDGRSERSCHALHVITSAAAGKRANKESATGDRLHILPWSDKSVALCLLTQET